MSLKIILQTIRPPFLVLTPVCVFLGLSTAISIQAQVDYLLFFIVMLGAISAHISVNTLNEYYDFKSGLDLKTLKTPFSGGSGALPNKPEMATAVLIIGLTTLLLTIAIGIYLALLQGLQILPIGLLGV
ncbi:MAG: 1,4-dihydroxy-2-naphthoate octaprenyltransferase, partial [Cycloclasticus sp.]